MRAWMVLLMAGLLHAQEREPEPGPVPIRIVKLHELHIARVKGSAHDALQAFLAAHLAHKKGQHDVALKGYLRFMGIAARAELPPRYRATVQARLKTMLAGVRARYIDAAKLYAKDRAKGLIELQILSGRYPMLPEGEAALALWQTDGLHAALRKARAEPDKKAAAYALEKAIRLYTAGLYRYEAKSLLVELGGPDLFKPGERVTERGGERRDGDNGETEIKSGGG